MSKALELRHERQAISVQMMAALDKNDMAQWRKLDGIQNDLRIQIEALERQSALQREMEYVSDPQRPPIGDSGPESQRAQGPLHEVRASAKYKSDFDKWLRTGEQSPEMRAIGAATGADGATLVPQGFEQELEVKIKYWGGLSNICRTIKTGTGNPLPWPTMDDTSNTGEWLAEGSGTGSADPTFSNVTLGANLISSKQVKISVQLEQDSAFDMGSLLSDAFGERLGRTLDTAYYSGDGSTIPVTGLLTALQSAGGRSVLAVGANSNSGNSDDTDLNSVGSDDFSALINALDRGYQKPTNKFVFNQTTENALRKVKDKYGRPIWGVSISQGEPDKIFGYGYQIDNAANNTGSGNVSVVFGDFSKYIIRSVLGITLVRFNELYMTNYQRAYQAFMRVDAKLLQAAAFSYLIHPQS